MPLIAALVFSSSAQGQWNTLYSGGGYIKDYYAVKAVNSDTCFVGGYDWNNFTGILLRTQNGGTSWDTLYLNKDLGVLSIEFLNADTGYITGNYGFIASTFNGGNFWYPAIIDTDYNNLNAIEFVSASKGYIVGDYRTILTTNNFGASWSKISYDSITYVDYYDVQFRNSNVGYIVGGDIMYYSGLILKTTNGGTTWDTTVVANTQPFHSIFMITDSVGFVISKTSILKTVDAGSTWTTIQYAFGNQYFNDIIFTDSYTGYIVGATGAVLKTSNTGQSWSNQNVTVYEGLYDIDFADVNTGYAVGYNGTILKTNNGGGLCPVANFEISPKVGCNGVTASFNFYDLSFTPDTLDSLITWYWDFGDGLGASTAQNPYYTYTALDTFEITQFVENTDSCISLYVRKVIVADECIWPGDADKDGTANNFDLLAVGIAYGDTGDSRTNYSNSWEPQLANDWKDSLANGTNFKHSDCDGNGVIDSIDVEAIQTNYKAVHAKTDEVQIYNAANPDLYFEISADTAIIGDTLIATIKLGRTSLNAANIYGVAFSIIYDPALVDSNVIAKFGGSWLGTRGTDLITLSKNDYESGTMDISLSRIDHKPRTGEGDLVKTTFVMVDNISGGIFTLKFDKVKLIDTSETDVPVNPMPDSVVVVPGMPDVENLKNSISIFPSPTSKTINIDSRLYNIEQINIYNLTGEIIYSNHIDYKFTKQYSIPVAGFSSGTYFVMVKTSQGTVNMPISIYR